MGPEQLLSEYERRLADHEFAAIEPLISPSATFWLKDGSFAGPRKIRAALERAFATYSHERYWIEDVQWVGLADELAVCAYRFRWAASQDGMELSGGGRGTTIMRPEAGQWKIVHEHLSSEPTSKNPA